jgi:heme-degrading monooxygenase HmoA
MVVRATLAEVDVLRRDPAEAIDVFRASVLPALHDEDGYEGCYVLLSDEGKLLVLSFWTDEEAAHASRESGFYEQQIAKFADLVVYRAEPGRESYDVMIADTPEVAVR